MSEHEISREDRRAIFRARLAGRPGLAEAIEDGVLEEARAEAVREHAAEPTVPCGAAGDSDGGRGSHGAGQEPQYGNVPLIDLAAQARAEFDDGPGSHHEPILRAFFGR